MKSNSLMKVALNKTHNCTWYRIANQLAPSNTCAFLSSNTPKNLEIRKKPTPTITPITYKWYRSVSEMPDVWSQLDIENIFLKKHYLKMLEDYIPEKMQFVYWIFFKEEHPIGLVYGQIQHFNLYNSVPSFRKKIEGNWWQRLQGAVKQGLAKGFTTNVLLIGNLATTGENGFYFNQQAIEEVDLATLLQKTIKDTLKQLKKPRIGTILFKEYFEENSRIFSTLKQYNYSPAGTEPNMIIHIRPTWNTFDDYLQAMTSKYRVRAKRAFKKGKGIEKKELSLEEIDQWNHRIFELYQDIANHVNFNALFLTERYFYGLKERLKEDFKLVAYFLDGQMIGFYTLIYDKHEIDAHFIGMDYQYNSKHQIYLNMLYDMIRAGIERKTERVVFARTANEIKSSVGAVPYSMAAFVKFKNPIVNAYFLRNLARLTQPAEWTPRQPFK